MVARGLSEVRTNPCGPFKRHEHIYNQRCQLPCQKSPTLTRCPNPNVKKLPQPRDACHGLLPISGSKQRRAVTLVTLTCAPYPLRYAKVTTRAIALPFLAQAPARGRC